MLNTMIVAAVTNFSGTTTPDKNGEIPVMLQCIAGIMPNRNVLSGTVARRAGFEVGKTYLVNVRETGYDDTFGPDFTFIKVMELSNALDLVRAAKELGDPRIQLVLRPEGFEQKYQRKGDAVEGNRAKRIKAGEYHPAYQTTIADHETADHITTGSSINSGGKLFEHGEGEDEGWPEPGDQNNQNENIQNNENEEQRDLPAEFYGSEEDQRANEELVRKITGKTNTNTNTGNSNKGNRR